MISSDERGNGSCFWAQVYGERVTRVYKTASPSSVKSTHCVDRLCSCEQKSLSLQHHFSCRCVFLAAW